MPITTWTRLELDTNDDTIAEGLAAGVYDPLWLLARQWQLGEFRGDDGGSPVAADVSVQSFAVDQLMRGGETRAFDARGIVLEALVEAEDGVKADVRLRARGGKLFLEQLAQHGIARLSPAVMSACAWPSTQEDADARALVTRLRGRTPDGDVVWARSTDVAAFIAALGVASDERARFTTVVATWRRWYGPRAGNNGPSSWNEERLEHAFGLGARTSEGAVVLSAPEYPGGRLDWDAFRIAAGPSREAAAGTTAAATYLPTPVDFPGKPATRFWEMEDARIDFGRVEAGPGDVGRMVLREFGLMWANDWFVVPLPTRTSTLNAITSLVVTDTFGVKTNVRPTHEVSPSADFHLFRMSGSGAAPLSRQYLFVPPVLPGSQQSEPLEEISWVRDEGANLAWAIERIVPTPSGRPTRAGQSADDVAPPRAPGEPLPAGTPSVLRYTPLSVPPPSWFPLAIVHDPAGSRFLQRTTIVDENVTFDKPQGVVLGALAHLRDDELPREGLTVRRYAELARSSDGSLQLWTTREKEVGPGEVSSGLRMDALEE